MTLKKFKEEIYPKIKNDTIKKINVLQRIHKCPMCKFKINGFLVADLEGTKLNPKFPLYYLNPEFLLHYKQTHGIPTILAAEEIANFIFTTKEGKAAFMKQYKFLEHL